MAVLMSRFWDSMNKHRYMPAGIGPRIPEMEDRWRWYSVAEK